MHGICYHALSNIVDLINCTFGYAFSCHRVCNFDTVLCKVVVKLVSLSDAASHKTTYLLSTVLLVIRLPDMMNKCFQFQVQLCSESLWSNS